ncbi:Bacterial type II secretion system protein N [Burkholderiales bacterium JOSHI_001]|nr:Bacterial type II secretion system protein N [Burkholderiales bacterium JOSHI_001]
MKKPALKLPWGGRRAGPRPASRSFAAASADTAAWQRARRGTRRWAVAGALLGTALALVVFAPARWLAAAVASATQQRLLLAEAEGTVWNGHALPVLTGGADSRDAAMLPGRLHWQLRPRLDGLSLVLSQACCMAKPLALNLRPGLGRLGVVLAPRPDALGQWPAAWLAGLGTPWNTLQLGGSLRLTAPGGFAVESVQGRWRLSGGAELDLLAVSSRLSTLDTLGSYRLVLRGQAGGADATALDLLTIDGALRLSGKGQWAGPKLRFDGEASAAPGQEAALANLLNIIARRRGAAHIISIG